MARVVCGFRSLTPGPSPKGRGGNSAGEMATASERRRDGAVRARGYATPYRRGRIHLLREKAVFAEVYFAGGVGGYVGVYYFFGWPPGLYQALLDPDHAVA